MAVIELAGVSARYGEAAKGRADVALDGVSWRVEAGDFACVLGPNGAGKSTLLRVVAGTLAPSAGEVRVFGKDPSTLTRAELARRVAVVPQVEEVAFGFSVEDVVLMGRAPHQDGWMTPRDEDRAVVEGALERCELGALRRRPVAELSGGERKRVGIARALAQEPELLLLDEPAAFLDVRHQLAMMDLLARLADSGERTVVCILHDLNIAAQYASRVALMKDGRLLASGTIEEVMTYRRLKETFDADLYCGQNDLTSARFFLPMRGRGAEPA